MFKPIEEIYSINSDNSISYEKNKSTSIKFLNTGIVLNVNNEVNYLIFKSKSSILISDIILIPDSEVLETDKIIHISEKTNKRIKINEYYFFKQLTEQSYSFNVGQYYNFFKFLDLYIISDILLSYYNKIYEQKLELLENISNMFLDKCLEFLNCEKSKERIFNRIKNGYLNNKGLCYYNDNLLIFKLTKNPLIIKKIEGVFKSINNFELEINDLIEIIEFFNEKTIPNILNCNIEIYPLINTLINEYQDKLIILKFKNYNVEYKFFKKISTNEVNLCDNDILKYIKNIFLTQIVKFEENIHNNESHIKLLYTIIEKLN